VGRSVSGKRVERRLAAVLAADVAGYSRLMGADEVGTARALREHRIVTDTLVAEHGGRLVKSTGDGVLLEFASVVDAVECAVSIQAVMAERNEGVPVDRRLLFRIGINLGDILIEGDDILGDGVNVAARLEGIADPGGIYISASAYDQVRGKVAVEFTDLGDQILKNIARPVRAYAARLAHQSLTSAPLSHSTERHSLPFPPDKPSIAVLPFQNMSGDPEQEYFADGMVEDIITSLSRLKSLLVIARNSSFTYKGKAVDIKQVGRELGVRYVLEGSVRRGGERLRITGQLIETSTGSHIWADRWDCGLADIFEAQDEITARIQNAIGVALNTNEARQVSRAGRNIQAWQLRVQAWEGFYRWDREGLLRGVELAREAIRLEPKESDAYVAAGSCLYSLALSGWVPSGRETIAEAVTLLTRAVNLDPENAMACTMLGVSLLAVGRPDEAVSQVARGSELAPGSYYGAVGSGIVLGYCGRPLESIISLDTALRVSPRDPRIYATYQSKCAPLFALDRYEDVVNAAQRVMRFLPEWPEALTMQAAALAMLRQVPEARRVVEGLLKLDARYSVKRALSRHPYRNAEDRDKLSKALVEAGLS